MKKRLVSVLLCFVLALALLPTAAFAAETKLKSVDIEIELPRAGDVCEQETQVTVKSIKSGGLDLLGGGSAEIPYTVWIGDDIETEDGEFLFRGGAAYLVTIKLSFEVSKGYCANYKMVSGSPVVGPDTFSATVNGQPATVRSSAPYYATLQVTLTIPGGGLSDQEQAQREAEQQAHAAAVAEAKRAMYPSRTWAEANELNLAARADNVVVMNGSDLGKGYELGYDDDFADGYHLGYLENFDNVGALILDIDDSAYENSYVAGEFTTAIVNCPYIKEVWLSDKVDVDQFIRRMHAALRSPLGGGPYYWYRNDRTFYTAAATVFVPESAVEQVREAWELYGDCYTIKTYSGSDVYAAQKAGAAAAKEWCAGHKYIGQIMSADRVYRYESCKADRRWYYSCVYCGKCEYDPSHTFNRGYSDPTPIQAIGHGDLYAYLATDEAYVGVNAAGEHVYWISCESCGRSHRYLQQHLTAKDVALTGGATLEQAQEEADAYIKMLESLALNGTEAQAGMFTLLRRNTAKVSGWAQSDVNLALNDNLLDTDLLGGDYTQNITRLQFCSIAVRLAEELTGRSITPAENVFTDTDNIYVLKAYAAGITTGTSATEFSPDAPLKRQQMAAFIYRTLQYVAANSDYAYSSYDSKLDTFADSAQVARWAKEPMAFMNALGLIKGTSATTLSPEGDCTIQQAIAVAERSVYAHQIGWHQVVTDEADGRPTFLTLPAAGTGVNTTPSEGDIVWVTGQRLGAFIDEPEIDSNLPNTFVPAINPYSGQVMYLDARFLRPIR